MTPRMPKVDLGRPATYDDVLAASELLVAELVGDELWTSPRPAPRHALAHGALFARIRRAFGEGSGDGGGWLIVHEPEVHLGRHALVPDIAGWRRERLPRLPDTAYFPLAPDWVCEVLSPSTEALDRSRKLPIYAEHGVGHAWLVDPVLRTLEVPRNDGGRWTLVATHAGAATAAIEPFAAVALDLAALWDEGGGGGGAADQTTG